MDGGYESDVVEIDLGEIIGLLWHRAWMIILCAILVAGLGFCFSKFVITEQFESTTKVYILNKEGNGTITYSDVQLGSQLTKDYAQLIMSRDVLERVIENCALTDSYGAFSQKIKVETLSDTRIIAITVTDEEPVMAQFIANEIRKEASSHIKDVMDIQAVNVVEEANLPDSPSSPNVGRWTVIGFLIGAFLCAAFVIVHFMLDDTIKTSEDVERYLGLSTLGMIPTREDAEKQKQKHKQGKHGSGTGRSSGGSRSSGGGVSFSTIDRGARNPSGEKYSQTAGRLMSKDNFVVMDMEENETEEGEI